MKNIPESITKISYGASSIADNIKTINKSLGVQAAIIVVKTIKNLAYARYKKLRYREGVGNTFNSSAMVLCVSRFSLLGYFGAAGDFVGKIY